MPPEESPEAKYDRLKNQLQDLILTDYPNPERKGCPGDAVLKELADRPLDQPVEDGPHWHHVTHCSECYREFLELKRALRSEAKARRARAGWTLAAGLVVVVLGLIFVVRQGWFTSQRPQNAELAYVKQTVDVPSMTRSAEANGDRKPPIVIPRKPVDLTLQLPIASPVGPYEFQLLREKQPVVSALGNATLENGTTSFIVRIDLSKLAPGMYEMSVRKVGWDWGYYPVEIRAD
jgi:hypothetical protein